MDRKNIVATVRDVAFVIGVGAISYGAWLIYHPVGYIVGGTVIALGCILHAMNGND